MSETITGVLEEIAIVKKGTGKKGPWTLRKITVDGEKYSTFDMIKATIGSTVEFEWTENDQGYKDVVRNSFVVTEEATPAKAAKTQAATTGETNGRQDSIERQVLLKCAVELAAVDGGIMAVAGYFNTLNGILRPAVKAKAAPTKPKPVAAEDENQDDQPDY